MQADRHQCLPISQWCFPVKDTVTILDRRGAQPLALVQKVIWGKSISIHFVNLYTCASTIVLQILSSMHWSVKLHLLMLVSVHINGLKTIPPYTSDPVSTVQRSTLCWWWLFLINRYAGESIIHIDCTVLYGVCSYLSLAASSLITYPWEIAESTQLAAIAFGILLAQGFRPRSKFKINHPNPALEHSDRHRHWLACVPVDTYCNLCFLAMKHGQSNDSTIKTGCISPMLPIIYP